MSHMERELTITSQATLYLTDILVISIRLYLPDIWIFWTAKMYQNVEAPICIKGRPLSGFKLSSGPFPLLVTLFPTISDEVFTWGMGKAFTRKGERAVTSAPPEVQSV